MNFIAATVELKQLINDPINAYGLDYCGADAVIPGDRGAAETQFRMLCFERQGDKLDAFMNWKPGNRALVTGYLVFSDDASKPYDFIVNTFEPNVPQDMYCNQVVLGNAFFGSDEIKDRKNDMVAIKVGSTLDNSDVTTWLFLETHESRKKKLSERVRKGRPICIHGQLREYRGGDNDSPYRAIVASDFTTREEKSGTQKKKRSTGSATGYSGTPDPTPDFRP